jgi:hypothetical protein
MLHRAGLSLRFLPLRSVVAAGLLAGGVAVAVIASQRSTATMADSANRFLAALSPEQRQQASFPYESDERVRWNFIPTSMFPRKGVPLKEMNEAQRQRALDLLKSGLSERGYMTATAIMAHETILKAVEEAAGTSRIPRDPELYFFSIFGTPSAKGTWGWRVEGHHVSLHFDVGDGLRVGGSTPSFFGANPAEVPSGPSQGLRILAAEEDAGRALLNSLDERQRAAAVITETAPNEIVTNNAVRIDPLSPAGLLAADMTLKQRALLMRLIEVYTSKMTSDVAAERLQRLSRAGVDKIGFAWAGATEPGLGKKHYYRIQGPTFLVEFDNTQNDANHIHSVWREFDGDFGRDLLREHVSQVPH